MNIDFLGKSTSKMRRAICLAVLSTLDSRNVESVNLSLSVAFLSSLEMKALNKRTRDINKVTDVLSFPNFDIKAGDNLTEAQKEDGYLGDVAICLRRAKAQAKGFKHSLEDELVKLAVHSTLHLLGFDHIRDEDYVLMQAEEDKALKIYEDRRRDV